MPQGSVLGSIVYINDLPNNLKSRVSLLFADDCVIYRNISVDTDRQTYLRCIPHGSLVKGGDLSLFPLRLPRYQADTLHSGGRKTACIRWGPMYTLCEMPHCTPKIYQVISVFTVVNKVKQTRNCLYHLHVNIKLN